MGHDLLRRFKTCEETLHRLDEYLRNLDNAPVWTLKGNPLGANLDSYPADPIFRAYRVPNFRHPQRAHSSAIDNLHTDHDHRSTCVLEHHT